MENFGQLLKNHREKQGIPLEEIASITKIQLHNLQCLEANKLDQLPPEPFIRGFITSYAKYIGLDPKFALEEYRKAVGKEEVPQSTSEQIVTSELPRPKPDLVRDNPAKVFEQTREIPIKKIGFALAGVFGLFLITSLIVIGKNSSKPSPVAEATQNAPITTANVAPTESPAIAAAANVQTQRTVATAEAKTSPSDPTAPLVKPAETSVPLELAKIMPEKTANREFAHEVSVDATDKSWAKVVIDDKAPVEMYTKAGEHTVFQAKEKIKLVLGNSSAASVSYNGQKWEGKKYSGTIRFFVFPKGARFPQDPPKRQAAQENESDAVPELQATPQDSSNH